MASLSNAYMLQLNQDAKRPSVECVCGKYSRLRQDEITRDSPGGSEQSIYECTSN